MRIKVFQAATMKEAMAQVKDELGDDAVILHTKKIKKGGILGYGAKEFFEVTAALDETPRRPPRKRAERLPTLAELQAQAAGVEEPPKSAVPLPQGRAGAPAAPVPMPTPVPTTAPVPTPVPTVAPLPAAAPLPVAAPAPAAWETSPAQAALQPQMTAPAAVQPNQRRAPRLSQNAAKSYRTAGTEAALVEAERRVRGAAPAAPQPAGASAQSAPAEPFVPSFPSEERTAPFEALAAGAEESAAAQAPMRKPRRRKAAPVRRKKPRAPEAAEAMEEAAPAPSRREKREAQQEAPLLPEKESTADDETAPVKSDEERQRETIEALQNELAQMKAMLVEVVSKEKAPEDELSLQQVLKQQEVEPDIIDDVVLQLPAEAILAAKDTPLALDGLTKYLADNVQMADGLELRSRKRKIVALLGPTGVGKTTTLAKIAAQCVLEKGISTAFITADTYRISAVEQLKTYADILGLPIAIVYTPDELKEAIQKFRQKQLILIDTAGRSQHNRRQMAELKDFLAVNQNIEKYLVLSATTKNEDARDIIDKFSACKPDKVIFTKTDETRSLGIILNILRKKDMRLSYLTNGQSVPDDIVPAEPGKLAELFLR